MINIILQHIACFVKAHHIDAECHIFLLDSNGHLVENIVSSNQDKTSLVPGHDISSMRPVMIESLRSEKPILRQLSPGKHVWLTALKTTSGTPLGSFSITFKKSSHAVSSVIGQMVILAELAARSIEYKNACSKAHLYQLIVSSIGNGILVIDKQGYISFSNVTAEKILYLCENQLTGRNIKEFIHDPETHDLIIKASKNKCAKYVMNVKVRRGDGKMFVADLIITAPMAYETELGAIISFYDIIAQERSMQDERKARENAENANNAKSQFLANISHELRTPLNAIIGFSEIIKRQILGPINNKLYCKYAENIYLSGQHVLTLINNILDISKIEANKMDIVKKTVHIPSMLKNCQILLGNELSNSGLSLKIYIPFNLQYVLCDEMKMRQILLNLLFNAIKFTPPGGHILLTVQHSKDNTLNIEIADTGIGIAPEDIKIVMQQFTQSSRSLNTKHKGIGLGLPLAKKLIGLHGGSMTIKSILNKGTIVTICLPGSVVHQ